MNGRRVSVVIPNRDGRHFLGPCLDALRRQTRRPDEIIVVDNGSTDGSLELLRAEYPEVVVLELGRNTGFSYPVNRGIEAAAGDYVALLNNDTECDPRWIEELVQALDANPDVGFCASKMLYHHERRLIDTAGDGFTRAGFGYKRGWLHRDEGQYDQPERLFGACAGAAMYRKRLFEEVGLFDEDFFAYHEDSDLSFRAQLAGYACLYVPTAVVYHHGGATSKRIGRNFSVRLSQRNMVYVLVKNLPGALWLRYGFRLMAFSVCSVLMGVWGGFGMAVLRGRCEAFKGLRTMLRKRRVIQQRRRVSLDRLASVLEPHWIRQMLDPPIRKRALRRQGIAV